MTDDLTRVAQDLSAIEALTADRELVAPAGNLEAWHHRLETTERTHYATCTAADHCSCDIAEHVVDQVGDELTELLFWTEAYRVVHDRESDARPTLASEAGFLRQVLEWAHANEAHFDDLAADVHTARVRLEDRLRAGERAEPGAPCLHCATALVRVSDPRRALRWCHGHGPQPACPWPRTGCCDRGGLRDEWRCPNPDCAKTYDDDAYWNAVGATYRAHAPAMTAADIALQYGVPAGSVRGWASTGKVARRGKDQHWRQLYDVAAVCRHAGIEPETGQTDRVS